MYVHIKVATMITFTYMQNIKTSIIVRELGKCEKVEMEKIWTVIDSDIILSATHLCKELIILM